MVNYTSKEIYQPSFPKNQILLPQTGQMNTFTFSTRNCIPSVQDNPWSRREENPPPSSPDRDSNLDLPRLGNLAQHETSALANYVTEALFSPQLTCAQSIMIGDAQSDRKTRLESGRKPLKRPLKLSKLRAVNFFVLATLPLTLYFCRLEGFAMHLCVKVHLETQSLHLQAVQLLGLLNIQAPVFKPILTKFYKTSDNWVCGDTFTQHRQCISEAEKYSAKGTKHLDNKGRVKQQEWIDTLNAVLDKKTNLLPEEKQLLQAISKHDNVPRKKKKFQSRSEKKVVLDTFVGDNKRPTQHVGRVGRFCACTIELNESLNLNFIQNSNFTRFTQKTLDRVWELLEKEFKHVKETKTPAGNANNTSKTENLNKSTNSDKEVGENLSKQARKDKKKKEIRKGRKAITKNVKDEGNLKEIGSKSLTITEVAEDDEHENLPKKGMKELKKNAESKVKNFKGKNQQNANIPEFGRQKRGGKKGAKTQNRDVVILQNGSKKNDKKKRQHTDNIDKAEEPTLKKIKQNGTAVQSESSAGKGGKFNWEDTIVKVLQSSKDKSLLLKRLKKRVLAEFSATNGGTHSKDALVKFNKKITKIPSVKVIKDVAKLMA
uniref:Uncharacterized protein n=1 Tax=Timema bartmani TaxID=61472 RepID=A0A7R9ER34_9NEOP|nr:unnamed protein product [Timema bartmani]